ncbi:MAG: hypothetical protein ACYDB1_01135 [Acidiferrobacteraceae bacterium]
MRKITIVAALPGGGSTYPYVAERLTELAGGVTLYPQTGMWRDSAGKNWYELGITYVLYSDLDIADEAAEIVRHAYDQACVMIEVADVSARLHYAKPTEEPV